MSLPNAGYKRNQIAVKTQMFTIPQRETSWNVFSQVLSPESSAFCPKNLKTFRNGGGTEHPPPPLQARTPVRDNCKKRDSIMKSIKHAKYCPDEYYRSSPSHAYVKH